MYHGNMRIANSEGTVVEFEPTAYLQYLAEHVESWSYLKFPFYKPMGYPEGCYRVGPLGRLNCAVGMSTPKAQQEFSRYKKMTASGLQGCTLLYHYARLIELLNCLEKAEHLLQDDAICSTDIRITAAPHNEEGVGIIEAPRGTLIHHYWVDQYGTMQKANLIVATGHNNIAMNMSVKLVAQEYIHNGDVQEGLLNRVEGAIRCYDPCLSCSTHALGQMPLALEILDAKGIFRQKLVRN